MNDLELSLLSALISNIPHRIYAKDCEGRFIYVNNIMTAAMGVENASELLGKSDFDFYPKEDATQYFAEECKIMRTGEPILNKQEHVSYNLKDDDYWLLTTKIPVADAEGKSIGLVGINYDITQQKRAELDLAAAKHEIEKANNSLKQTVDKLSHEIKERKKAETQLQNQAVYDGLTGLPSRAIFLKRIQKAIQHAQSHTDSITILQIHIEELEKINDQLGHEFGDRLLKNISVIIDQCLRNGDTLARLGDCDFAILLPDNITEDSLTTIGEQIYNNIKEPFKYLQREVILSCSIGCCSYPEHSDDAEILLKMADAATKQRKDESTRFIQTYSAKLNEDFGEKLSLEAELKHAITNKEFTLYYQPQLDLENDKIIGVEALIRWFHPFKGLIPPNIFIPIAEEIGLIDQIGEWVMWTAAEQAKQWLESGLDIRVSVNLSAHQLMDQTIESQFQTILEKTNLPAKYLDVELTESASMQNPEEMINILRGLKTLGIALSIDDFGTGYSNFAYLKKLSVDYLKIDRSFIADMNDADGGCAIVEAIIAMGHKLNLKLIAEGVETKEQLNKLKAYQCDLIQGYYFAKPMDASECTEFINKTLYLATAKKEGRYSVPAHRKQ